MPWEKGGKTHLSEEEGRRIPAKGIFSTEENRASWRKDCYFVSEKGSLLAGGVS